MNIAHTAVLSDEVLEYLKPRGIGELMVDATIGEGGHSEVFLSTFPDLGVAAVDADAEILDTARRRLAPFGERVRFYHNWFNLFFAAYPPDLERPDTILLDLGISTFHYETAGRGFSFKRDEALDMRLSNDLDLTARDIVNDYPETELADLLYEFGEERYSRRIAHAINERRRAKPIETSSDLAGVVARAVPPNYRYGRIHPATRSFQALRIAVNGELGRLDEVLPAALAVLKVGGRIGVISFHSLEDRRVKLFLREKNKSCTCPPEQPMCSCGGRRVVQVLTRKPIVPTPEERSANAASRSAKLRVALKLEEDV